MQNKNSFPTISQQPNTIHIYRFMKGKLLTETSWGIVKPLGHDGGKWTKALVLGLTLAMEGLVRASYQRPSSWYRAKGEKFQALHHDQSGISL